MCGYRRCGWVNPKNPQYIRYHDEEWGVPVHDDRTLLEYFTLEPFQAGLSWEIVLKKRERFAEAFEKYDLSRMLAYTEETIETMAADASLIRSRRKIETAFANAAVFDRIRQEYGTFSAYLWDWTEGQILREVGPTRTPLSDAIAADLKKRGVKGMGSITVYAFLQAVGVICAHDADCFCLPEKWRGSERQETTGTMETA